jgi:hypothetical protein
MKLYVFLPVIFLVAAFLSADSKAPPPPHPKGDNSDWFFKLNVSKGEKLSNIFSGTVAYQGDGFAPVVQRVSGTGVYTVVDGEKVKMDIVPGRSTWSGYTTFKNHIIISDELLVTRPISLKNDSLNFSARQREYILLNAMSSD